MISVIFRLERKRLEIGSTAENISESLKPRQQMDESHIRSSSSLDDYRNKQKRYSPAKAGVPFSLTSFATFRLWIKSEKTHW